MIDKIKYGISALILIITGCLMLRRPNITIDTIRSLDKEIKIEIENSLKGGGEYEAFFFMYYEEYSKRVVLIREEGIVNPNEEVEGDVFFSTALAYHLADLCVLSSTEDIPEGSLRDALELKDNINEDTWYISCPVYFNSRLIGYTSAVRYIENSIELLPAKLRMQLLSSKIERLLNEYL